MANSWLRLWHDMPNDPKWRTIARISGQPISLVQAVFLHLLVSASQSVTRGHADVTNEDLASHFDVTERDIEDVINAMQGRVLDGNYLTGWAKRQVKKEDVGNEETGAKSATQRKREQRERQRHQSKSQRGSKGCHDKSRSVTTDKDKDKDKDLKPKNTLVHGEKIASEPGGNFSAAFPDYPKADPTLQSEADSDAAGQPALKNRNAVYPEEFELAWREYPRRAGANSKKSAYSAWHARRREGVSPEVMLDGVRRYVKFLQASDKSGTQYVQRASTFFGPDRNFEYSWSAPPAATTTRHTGCISPADYDIPDGFRSEL